MVPFYTDEQQRCSGSGWTSAPSCTVLINFLLVSVKQFGFVSVSIDSLMKYKMSSEGRQLIISWMQRCRLRHTSSWTSYLPEKKEAARRLSHFCQGSKLARRFRTHHADDARYQRAKLKSTDYEGLQSINGGSALTSSSFLHKHAHTSTHTHKHTHAHTFAPLG